MNSCWNFDFYILLLIIIFACQYHKWSHFILCGTWKWTWMAVNIFKSIFITKKKKETKYVDNEW